MAIDTEKQTLHSCAMRFANELLAAHFVEVTVALLIHLLLSLFIAFQIILYSFTPFSSLSNFSHPIYLYHFV